MNSSKFMSKYNIVGKTVLECEKFALSQKEVPVKKSLGGFTVSDMFAQDLYDLWSKEQNAKKIEREAVQSEDDELQKVARQIPVTSTFNFEGYRIVQYSGYISGDEVILMSDSWFTNAKGFSTETISDTIKDVRSSAINELKKAAAQLGCNAVVGLDFDYVTINRQQVSIVSGKPVNETYVVLTANGTAVIIEPIED